MRCVTPTSRRGLAAALTLLVATVSCAPKRTYNASPVPEWDLVRQMTLGAPEHLSPSEKAQFEVGWRALREGQLDVASAELDALSRRYAKSPEVATAVGYLELRLGNAMEAEREFQSALRENPAFAPAESGYFLVALRAGDEEQAFTRLSRLEETHPQDPLVERYATTLRVNVAESRLRSARELVAAGRFADAAAAYLKVLQIAPEAGSLYLEAAATEFRAGLPDRASAHARRATELEPSNADALRVLGEASYAASDLEGAARAFRTASSLRPGDAELASRRDVIEKELREKTLPPQYLEIGESERLTREQLAALLCVGLRNAMDGAAAKANVIATDISDSWAADYIRRGVASGVLEVFPNHTFQPKAFVNRIELARTMARVYELIEPEAYQTARQSSERGPDFPDVSRENLNHEAAALAVALGLLSPLEDGRFEPQRFASGADGVKAVEALAVHVTP